MRRAIAAAWAATALVSPEELAAVGQDARGSPPALTLALRQAPCVLSVVPGSTVGSVRATHALDGDPSAPPVSVCLVRVRPNPWGGTDYLLPGGRTISCRPHPDGHQECW